MQKAAEFIQRLFLLRGLLNCSNPLNQYWCILISYLLLWISSCSLMNVNISSNPDNALNVEPSSHK